MNFYPGKLTAVSVAAILLTMLARSEEPKKVDSVSFEDLFHMSAQDAEIELGAQRAARMKLALEDFNSVLAFKRPTNAKFKEAFRDSGSSTYEGDGYKLNIVKGLTAVDGKKRGYMYGPMLFFNDSRGGAFLSRVSYYPKETLQKRLADD